MKKELGQAFIDWVISPEGQKNIAEYKIGGEQLFFPNANDKGANGRPDCGRGDRSADDDCDPRHGTGAGRLYAAGSLRVALTEVAAAFEKQEGIAVAGNSARRARCGSA